jgi:uncharacterized protein (UPF0332 family)
MSATASDLVQCASAQLQTASDEAAYRSVCSRAYYGAYHAAKAFHDALPQPGSVGTASGKHEQLIAMLTTPQISKNNKKHARSIALGKSLRILADRRVTADYKIHLTVVRNDAFKSEQDAVALLNAAA